MQRLFLMAIITAAVFLTGCDALSIVSQPKATPKNVATAVPTALPSPTTAPTTTPVPATATPNPAANPLDTLKRVFTGWGSVKSFRGKLVRTGGTAAGESTFEAVTPDRIHTIGKTESIIIGNVYYLKVGTKWTKSTLPQGFDLSFADYKKILDQLGTTTDVKFVGPEVLDGAPMLVYQYTFTSKIQSATITTNSKVWVSADGLPRKSESTSSTSPGSKTVVTYFDYNAPITINTPIP